MLSVVGGGAGEFVEGGDERTSENGRGGTLVEPEGVNGVVSNDGLCAVDAVAPEDVGTVVPL